MSLSRTRLVERRATFVDCGKWEPGRDREATAAHGQAVNGTVE